MIVFKIQSLVNTLPSKSGDEAFEFGDFVDNFSDRSFEKFHQETVHHIETILKLFPVHEYKSNLSSDFRFDKPDSAFEFGATRVVHDQNHIRFALLVIQENAGYQKKSHISNKLEFLEHAVIHARIGAYEEHAQFTKKRKVWINGEKRLPGLRSLDHKFDLCQLARLAKERASQENRLLGELFGGIALLGIQNKKPQQPRPRLGTKQRFKHVGHIGRCKESTVLSF